MELLRLLAPAGYYLLIIWEALEKGHYITDWLYIRAGDIALYLTSDNWRTLYFGMPAAFEVIAFSSC